MKIAVIAIVLVTLCLNPAFASGTSETSFAKSLVNEQEIDLSRITSISIRYYSDNLVVSTHSDNNIAGDNIVIREYMNRNDSRYFAKISRRETGLLVESGERPVTFVKPLLTRIEISIPESDRAISIKTTSGKISIDSITAAKIDVESSSGKIEVGRVAGSITAKTTSGGFSLDSADGDTSVSTSSGSVVLGNVNGNVFAKTASGRIEAKMANGNANISSTSASVFCTVLENAGDISINTTSGSVNLSLPRTFVFNFSANTSSGSLRTPFDNSLSRPFTGGNRIQGAVGTETATENQTQKTVDITTGSGSIRVNWTD
jgi:DUF4097 and DUF4098 domain-containing protein YvlB